MSQGTSTQVHVSQGGQDRYVEAVPSVIITEDSPVSTGTDSSLLSQEESCLLTAPSPRHSRGTASSRNSGNVLSGKRRAQLCEYSTETRRLVEIEEEKLAIKKKRLEIEQEKLQILRNVYSLLQEKSTSSVPSFSRLLSEF
ncbi:uncharacterized protein LOC133183285 isoform X3 [Saccostrea echinata]|uniref:uncharacterized protein LOC133183285 isoform X3 n=1 Tax=Saccostrea echinata TaxID=191078 RepID=UPI002A82A430|nr:uncharacterized protein LOC133183285 isoform X3 [Saccostrea echinata]